jgi:2,4-dienoyl-CoA reductase-like NADH-dependent reductase (Old Yellow Enzyme family)
MSRLFQAGRIGTLEIPNRIVRSATAERLADDITGYPKPGLTDLLVELARGGTGLIITGHMYVLPSGKCHPEMVGIHDDGVIPVLSNIVSDVHKEGAKIAVQINHGGMQCSTETVQGTIAPSAINEPFLQQPAREMTKNEIVMLIESYAQAARRAKEAGFDGVQLHGAHGYLINQFISPFVNHRGDDWGGNFQQRIKFLREVTKAVRGFVGSDYPVFIKFGMEDGVEGGITTEAGVQVIREMAKMGLDAVEISGGIQANNSKKGIKSRETEAYFRDFARKAKQATNLPILLVGGLRSRDMMEDVLESGDADFVSLCRPLINEPNLPKLLHSGEVRVSDCISSNNCWPNKMNEGIRCKCLKNSE